MGETVVLQCGPSAAKAVHVSAPAQISVLVRMSGRAWSAEATNVRDSATKHLRLGRPLAWLGKPTYASQLRCGCSDLPGNYFIRPCMAARRHLAVGRADWPCLGGRRVAVQCRRIGVK